MISQKLVELGDRIGSFTVKGYIGGGACAQIYRVVSSTGGEAVLKVFSEAFSAQPFYSMILLHETDKAACSYHPNIIRILEAGFSNSHLYMAMDLIDGETLFDTIQREGKIKASRIFGYGLDISAGLQWLEEKMGHFHRDVKPSNIMISRGRAILIDLDFDTLRINSDHNDFVWGTPEYLAPEMMRSTRQADRLADIYALGCTLYHAITGHPPFWHERGKNATALEVAHLHSTGTLKLPSLAVPGLPRRAVQALTAAMARRPSQRTPDYPELIKLFQNAQNDCLAMDL